MGIRIIAQSIWKNPGNRGQKLRRTAYAVGWQAWKRLVAKPRMLNLPNGRKFMAHPDCVVSSSLIYSRVPEFHEISFVRSVLEPSDVVIDIGANVGHIGLLLSDIVAPENLLEFEPTPITFSRLCENWSINGFPLDGLNQVAIGDHNGSVTFPDLSHPGTMNRQVSEGAPAEQRTADVILRCLDYYRERLKGKQIGLLKIDVEGNEASVFRGARQMLRNDRPQLIMFESLDGEVDTVVLAELNAADYRVFQLDVHGKPMLHVASNQNLFAAPNESIDKVMEF